MNFKGTATKITPEDIASAAQKFGVPEAALRAVMSVETDGHGFDKEGRPEILFERHKFYQNVPPVGRSQAMREGLAYPVWGTKPYPRTPDLRWEEFMRAVAIDERAAIMSASWGLGQIMGSEFEEAGYTSPQEMITAFCESEVNQILGMCNLIARRHLDKDLRNFPQEAACADFALHYNGAGYRKNQYDTKLAEAFKRFNTHAQLSKVADVVGEKLVVGASAVDADRHKRIMELQKELKAGGVDPGPIDGVLGKRTIEAFQQAQKLTVDGVIGDETRPLLEQALAAMEIV